MRVVAAPCSLLAGFALVACKLPSIAPASQDASTDTLASASVERECRSDSGCTPHQVCVYTPGLCGKGMRPGACHPKPASCDAADSPVCGCDGKIYDSECWAYAAGVDLAVMGGCKERIANYAACGRRYCDVRTSYCEIFLSDVFELPTDYFCRPLPPSCSSGDGATLTCDCFPAGTRCRAFCGTLPTTPGGLSGFHLTCQGTRPPLE